MLTGPPICESCRHYRPDAVPLACAAFPEGIPAAIIDSDVDHHRPFPGDRGIRFEQDPSKPRPPDFEADWIVIQRERRPEPQ